MNDNESDAMWKIYVNGTGGVAVRSTISRLKQSFHASKEDVSLGKIEYIDSDHVSKDFFDGQIQRFMRKKVAFKHEQEVRLAYYDEGKSRSGDPGIHIPVDVNVLIEKIVISPRADDWFQPLVKAVVSKLGYSIDVVASEGAAPVAL